MCSHYIFSPMSGLDFDRWLNAPGPPLTQPDLSQGSVFTSSVEALNQLWMAEPLDIEAAATFVNIADWQTFQTVLFLDKLLDQSPLRPGDCMLYYSYFTSGFEVYSSYTYAKMTVCLMVISTRILVSPYFNIVVYLKLALTVKKILRTTVGNSKPKITFILIIELCKIVGLPVINTEQFP